MTNFALSDDVVKTFIRLLEEVRDKQFLIGDALNDLIAAHGNKAQVINYLAGALNVSASTLYDYSRVAETWTLVHRETYQALDWTIYRNTDPNEPADIELLEMCIDEGWNASRLKAAKYPQTEDALTGALLSLISRLRNSEYTRLKALGDLLRPVVERYLAEMEQA